MSRSAYVGHLAFAEHPRRLFVVACLLCLALTTSVGADALPFHDTLWSRLTTSPVVWLDATEGVTTDANNQVTLWEDRSSSQRDAIPIQAGRAPALATWNGNDVVAFSGAQQMTGSLAGLISDQQTTFAVFTYSGTQPWQRVFSQYRGTGHDHASGNYIPIVRHDSNNEVTSYLSGTRAPVAVPRDTWAIFGSTHTGTHITNWANGGGGVTAAAGALSAVNYTTYGLGDTLGQLGNGPLTGAIAEVLVFDAALGEPERQLVEGYLAHKWWDTRQINPLPAEHPFYRSDPVSVISLDFDHGGLGTKSGMEPGGFLGEIGGLWNSLPVAQSAKAGPLQTGDGSPTLFDVTFEFVDGTDSYRTYASSGDVLRGDVVFLQSGTDQVGPLDWEIAGLMPGLAYDLKFFGQMQDGSPNNAATFLVDGYGSIATNDVATFLSVPADSDGKITGSLLHETGTYSAWSGLQIRGVFVPEPSTGLLAVLAFAGSFLFRSRRRRAL